MNCSSRYRIEDCDDTEARPAPDERERNRQMTMGDSATLPNLVYCDFNAAVDEWVYDLGKRGTLEDLKRLGIGLAPGMVLAVYMDDADTEGNADPLIALGIVDHREPWGYVVCVDPASLRHASNLEQSTGLRAGPRPS
jgi:hypothetical protein